MFFLKIRQIVKSLENYLVSFDESSAHFDILAVFLVFFLAVSAGQRVSFTEMSSCIASLCGTNVTSWKAAVVSFSFMMHLDMFGEKKWKLKFSIAFLTLTLKFLLMISLMHFEFPLRFEDFRTLCAVELCLHVICGDVIDKLLFMGTSFTANVA
jgi:hypothetical protein